MQPSHHTVRSHTTKQSSGPPPGYVPGLGRGAIGFTTRSDVVGAGAAAVVGDGTKSRSAEARLVKQQQQDQVLNSEEQFRDPEEEEADEIWDFVDARMKGKRKREDDDDDDDDGKNRRVKQIGAQFRELKEQLADVTEDQWAAIPDVGDYSLKYKQKRRQQDAITPISDSLLEQRHLQNSERTQQHAVDATDGGTTTVTNMSGLSAARGTVLGMSLDKQKASGNATSVDASGYLTSLQSTVNTTTSAELHDMTKARLLLQSVRDTNPHHGPGWIAAARVEETAGNTLQARKLIQQACATCPKSPDVWLEAARLHPVPVAKSILATAVRQLPHCVALYRRAADLETSTSAKQAVLRTALEANPTSVTLWKAAVALEDSASDARVLLAVAVEQVPHATELWLALAKLETYQTAQTVLNRARQAVPTDRSIWIAAAQLEEGQGNDSTVHAILRRAVQSLRRNEVVVSRDDWIRDAESAAASGAPHTAAAIIQHAPPIMDNVDTEDQLRTWSEDVKALVQRGSIVTARALVTEALTRIPQKRKLWMQAVELERNHGDSAALDTLLERACTALPNCQVFWLLRAKEKWRTQKDVAGARTILTQAFDANPDAEDLWLAAAKLEWETQEVERARVLLQRARERAPSERVYIQSAILEREVQQAAAALDLIERGLELYPKAAKLYMMGGQICDSSSDGHTKATMDAAATSVQSLDRARKFYQRGIEACPTNHVLWTLASRLEETSASDAAAGSTKARSVLEIGRRQNPNCPELWLEAIRLERRGGNGPLADTLMAKALQECPTSGVLWAETIATAPRVQQKSKATDAIKRCPEDPHVIAAVASFFASERKYDKARKWFDRAVVLDPDLGDAWARYYAFEKQRRKPGDDEDERLTHITQRCEQAEPKHGEMWASIMKESSYNPSDANGKSPATRKRTIAEGLELASEQILQQKISSSQAR